MTDKAESRSETHLFYGYARMYTCLIAH